MKSLYPSLVSSDLMNLEQDIKKLEPYCQGFHLNIMDFHFVQKLDWSTDAVNRIRKATHKKMHVHLMVQYPEKYIPLLQLNAHDIVSIHIESQTNEKFEQLLKNIQLKQLIPSIAITPFTPLEGIIGIQFPFEHVLVMSAIYEHGKPRFLPHSLEKIKQLALFKKSHNLSFDIAIDGGITIENLRTIAETDANQIVISSNILGHNSVENLKIMIELTKAS